MLTIRNAEDWTALFRAGHPEGVAFTPEAADARHDALPDPVFAIPEGPYCYTRTADNRVVPCPFWGHRPDAPQQQSGYCAHLRTGDQDEAGGVSLLWDQVKECGLREGDDCGPDDDAAC